MMHVAKKEGRIFEPVLLKIHLDVLFRDGVRFSDCNAARRDALLSETPNQVRFEIVKANSAFAVATHLRKFYQAEVLVPSPIPPEFIVLETRSNKILSPKKQHPYMPPR